MRRTHFICTVPGCGQPHHAHGFCQSHGHRERRHGSPGAGGPSRARVLEQRLEKFINRTSTCWLWTGSTRMGYGQVTVGSSVLASAHRLVYELLVGPIPDGLVLDHLCRTKNCVRPDHLEPVTQAENLRRARSAA